ncbi:DUF6263 family protein [Nonlabens marinus]|uniref:Lipocalin-like domain-containing protein n=1 Tax=Nonlabens marinus S1-08 TaxID=1454201 RepID=W8VR24_9FLAO|nr:DUF6263 family protein [Nonlabens marinus]BAO56044.1 hypothetical protein NMS_2035 [Nonlabens marinus S1-08]
MKNLIAVLFLAVSIQAYGQESALLRLNYNEGDTYEVKVVQKQSTGIQGGTDMTILMDMKVAEVTDDLIKTESKISSVSMDINQGGMSMTYDSTKSDEELDATGKMLKSQLSPMMNAVIYSSIDVYGNTLETTSEPAVPGIDQFTTGQAAINYPKEKVSVGSSWTTENSNQGMNVKTTYTVTKIADGMVYLDIKGDVSGAGSGSMTGESVVEISTGTAKTSDTEITVSAQGIEVTVASNVQMTKK